MPGLKNKVVRDFCFDTSLLNLSSIKSLHTKIITRLQGTAHFVVLENFILNFYIDKC